MWCVPLNPVTSSNRKDRQEEVREYKHVEVPHMWYSLSSLLLSNGTSLTNMIDELIVPVRSTCANIVAIFEAWQILPEVCVVQDFQLFHHLKAGRRGSDVALFCSDTSHLPVHTPTGVEVLWVQVTRHCHPSNAAFIILC